MISALWLIVPAISAIAVLAGLAWLFRRAACYTITTKRVLFQFGVALPMTMNIPLSKIANAALKTYRDGSGDIPLRALGRQPRFVRVAVAAYPSVAVAHAGADAAGGAGCRGCRRTSFRKP